jgi:antagonist of KipI
MGLRILTNGLLATVQDLGRPGARQYGIGPGGAMDRDALRLANLVLGNRENAACVELHFPAPAIEFTSDATFAIGGADLDAALDDVPLAVWTANYAPAGSILRFRGARRGCRAYLAVRGGLAIEPWLGSRSTNLMATAGGYEGRALKKGDTLEVAGGASPPARRRAVSPSIIPPYSTFPTLRMIEGPEFEHLTIEAREGLCSSSFELTAESNRMGLRLDGPRLELANTAEMISSPVVAGTVQLPAGGKPILLMADHQTTGGYPRIGSVISCDIPLAAQLCPRSRLAFQIISVAEAQEIELSREREFAILRAAAVF